MIKSILDPCFVYTPSVHTDIRKTFARLAKAQREAAIVAEAEKRSADELAQAHERAIEAEFARRRMKVIK
jgi:hypothetical protein